MTTRSNSETHIDQETRTMLNRRSFITISAAGLGAVGVMTPVLAVAQDSPSGDRGAEIQIGPVAVLSGKTVLRVAVSLHSK